MRPQNEGLGVNEKKTKKIKEVSSELEVQNKNKPLWTRVPKDTPAKSMALFKGHHQRLGGPLGNLSPIKYLLRAIATALSLSFSKYL